MDKNMRPAAGLYPQMADTAARWAEKNPLIPVPNLLLIEYQPETQTRKIKLTDGVRPYNELPYLLGGELSEEFLSFLSLHNQPGGVVILNEDGIIDISLLPKRLYGSLSIVGTYADLLTRSDDPESGELFRSGPVIVQDATDDPSGLVQSGGAYYTYIETDGWVKVAEFKEPEISLVDYFKYQGANQQTLGSISDDIDTSDDVNATDKYSKVSNFLLRKLEQLAVTSTDGDLVLYSHAIIVEQLDAASLSEFPIGSP